MPKHRAGKVASLAGGAGQAMVWSGSYALRPQARRPTPGPSAPPGRPCEVPSAPPRRPSEAPSAPTDPTCEATSALAERPASDEGAALVAAARVRTAPDHGRPAPPAGKPLFRPGSSPRLRHAEEPGTKKSRGQPPGAGDATCGTRAPPEVGLSAGHWHARYSGG